MYYLVNVVPRNNTFLNIMQNASFPDCDSQDSVNVRWSCQICCSSASTIACYSLVHVCNNYTCTCTYMYMYVIATWSSLLNCEYCRCQFDFIEMNDGWNFTCVQEEAFMQTLRKVNEFAEQNTNKIATRKYMELIRNTSLNGRSKKISSRAYTARRGYWMERGEGCSSWHEGIGDVDRITETSKLICQPQSWVTTCRACPLRTTLWCRRTILWAWILNLLQ